MVKFCDDLVNNGVCLTKGCTLNHNIVLCDVCKIVCENDATYQAHLRGKKYRTAVQRAESGEQHSIYRCGVCGVPVAAGSRAQHEAGRQHRQNSARYGLEPQPVDTALNPDAPYCRICSVYVTDNRVRHTRSANHLRKERFAALNAAFSESETDKHGVIVSRDEAAGVDFGTIEPTSLQAGSILRKQLKVELSTLGKVVLSEVRMSSELRVWRARKFV